MQKTIEANGVEYVVNEFGRLCLINILNNDDEEIIIPHVLPDGTAISEIDESFVPYVKIEHLYISDGITKIPAWCFQDSHIKKVRWPSTCDVIPEFCFADSDITEVTNIGHVKAIDTGAFEGCPITQFHWPAECTEIPIECFAWSDLTEISGIENVKKIGHTAFAQVKMENFRWPSKCKTIPYSCFQGAALGLLSGIDNIEKIEHHAFANCGFGTVLNPEIDLSNLPIIAIEESAFDGFHRQNVKFPFYMSEEVIERILSNTPSDID